MGTNASARVGHALFICLAAFAGSALLYPVGFLSDDFGILMRWGVQHDGGYLNPAGEIFFRPVVWFLWRILYELFGINYLGYRVVHIGLHAGCSILVYLLALRLFQSARTALVAGLLFAIHPIHAEVVAWLCCNYDLLATFLVLSALWLYLKYAQGREIHFLLASLFCAVLAVYSKESAIALPLMVTSFVVCSCRARDARLLTTRNIAGVFSFTAVSVGFLLHRYFVLGGMKSYYNSDLPGLLQLAKSRLWPAVEAVTVDAFRLMFAPFNKPLLDQFFPTVWPFLWVLAVVPGALLFFSKGQKSWRRWGLFLALVVAALVPVYGLLNPEVFTVDLQNTRYLYLPSAFFVMALAPVLTQPGRLRRIMGTVYLAAILCVYVVNQLPWVWASHAADGILYQVQDKAIPVNVFVDFTPDNVYGAYVYRNCFEIALRVFVPDDSFGGVIECPDRHDEQRCAHRNDRHIFYKYDAGSCSWSEIPWSGFARCGATDSMRR